MTDVRFVPIPDTETVRVSFRYDPEVVSLVKQVSPGLRSYDGATKSWTVNESVAEQLVDSIVAAGHSVSGAEAPIAIAAPTTVAGFFGTEAADDKTGDRAYVKAKAQEFLATIPEHLRHRVFRAMAREMYPDLYPARNS